MHDTDHSLAAEGSFSLLAESDSLFQTKSVEELLDKMAAAASAPNSAGDGEQEPPDSVTLNRTTQVGGAKYRGKPKTSSGEDRVVALAPELVGALIAHQLQQAGQRDIAGSACGGTGLVFTRADGTGWNPNWVSARFQQLGERAGLRRIHFHDLRHGTASLALANGVDMAVVSKMLGHSTVSFTIDRYTHLLEGVGQQAAAAVAAGVPRRPVVKLCDNR